MSRLLVHIGLPKAGSSAIQAHLAANASRLSDAGFCWLPGSHGNNLTELAVAISAPEAVDKAPGFGMHRLLTERGRERLRARLGGKITSSAGPRDVIISSEHLSGLLRSCDDVARLAAFLQGMADQIVIIGVIRRADHWLPSAYVEAVRSGRKVRLGPGFVERRAHLLDHRELIKRWSGAFDDVRLVPYLESDKSDPAALPKRFLLAVGVPPAVIETLPAPQRLTRAGISAEAVEVLRRINPELDSGSWRPRDRERLMARLAELHPGPGVRLTPAALRALADHGWIDSGVDTSPAAYGSGWPEWRTAAPAPVSKPPHPSDAEIDATLQALRQAGFGTHRAIIGRARQTVGRIRR